MRKYLGDFLRVYLACTLALFTAMVAVKADPPTGNGSPGVSVTSPTSTVTVGGTSFNPTVDLNLSAANTWLATQTFPNIMDTGIAANTPCIGTDASNQFIANAGGCGNVSISSPAATISVGGTLANPTLDLAASQPASRPTTWNSPQTYLGGFNQIEPSTTPCTGVSALLLNGICIAGNSSFDFYGIVLGPTVQSAGGLGCAAACTASDSMRLCFAAQHAGGSPTYVCDYQTNGGTRVIGCTSTCSTNNAPFSAGNITHGSGACSGSSPVTSAAGVWDCSITSVTSSATLNFGTAFALKPVCYASDETAAATLKVVPATGSVTVTGQGASDVIDIACFGNG